jgi:hypothetical protein
MLVYFRLKITSSGGQERIFNGGGSFPKDHEGIKVYYKEMANLKV